MIILDEPFSGLDPVNANLIKEEIHQLAQKGCSIIFSTHRMEQVEEICDHIILVNKGKKILDGTVNAVKQQFKENIFSISCGQSLEQLPAGNAFTILQKKGNEMTVKIGDDRKPNDVLRHFLDNGMDILGFRETLPSLNDIFIRLVEGTSVTRQFEQQKD